MKILLTAINAKYIHSNLAVYSLRAYAHACLAAAAVRCVVNTAALAPCPAVLAATSVVRTALRPVRSAVLIVLPVPFTAAFPEVFIEAWAVLIVFSPRSNVLTVCFGSSRICAPFFPACSPAVRPVCTPVRFFICSFGW